MIVNSFLRLSLDPFKHLGGPDFHEEKIIRFSPYYVYINDFAYVSIEPLLFYVCEAGLKNFKVSPVREN